MKFEETYLNDNILDALYDMHFDDCTPIQEGCIPQILDYHDVIGIAQTGTGKTAAYLLPILSMLDDGGYPKDAINCIIMSPTRELAQQIDQAMQGFGYYLDGISSVAVYGGNDGPRYDQEMKSLRMGADVVIATPGRLLSHIRMGNVDLSRVSFFVLDEADRMLDMGFSDDIMQIVKLLPSDRQTILFSATMPEKIQSLAKSILKDPVEVKIAVSKPAEKIHQMAYICYEPQKLGIIRHLFKGNKLKRVICFSGKKDKVKEITRQLKQIGVNDDIQMVINYDVPHDCEDYVHRIGRTARADREGEAVTLVSDKDMYAFGQIEDFLEKDIEKIPLPGDLGDAPEYSKQRPNSPRHGKRGKGHGRRRSPAKGKTSAGKRGKSRSAKTSDKKKDNASREKIKE